MNLEFQSQIELWNMILIEIFEYKMNSWSLEVKLDFEIWNLK